MNFVSEQTELQSEVACCSQSFKWCEVRSSLGRIFELEISFEEFAH